MRAILLPSLLFLVALSGCATTSTNPTTTASITNQELVGFSSAEGMLRLQRSNAKADFFLLANNFESQQNGIVCGPTSAAIVLNSLRLRTDNKAIPKDSRAVDPKDRMFLPKGLDPLLQRYTPNALMDASPKPRVEVFGKPVKIEGKDGADFGYQIRQLATLLSANGLDAKLHIADDKVSDEILKTEMLQNLARQSDFVLINYQRTAIGQKGGGHISPVGAYDQASDSFLVMDVNPTKAEWVWVPSAILIKGMRTFDTVENRGIVLVSEKK